jgi:hypothetical protein
VRAHGAAMRRRRDVGGAAHVGDLVRVLDQAHLVEFDAHVADFRRRAGPLRTLARTRLRAATRRSSQLASCPIE